MQKLFAVSSICNALVDILLEVDDKVIQELGLTRGIMHLVDKKRQKDILQKLQNHPQHIELGGSSMNAIRTLAALGHRSVFAGMVADDEFGQRIERRMQQLGIKAVLHHHGDEPTGSCVVLIGRDGERTMNTHLGASCLYDRNLVPHDDIAQSKIFHFSGYQWDTGRQTSAIKEALDTAEKHGTLVSFDLADPFVVKNHQKDFVQLIAEKADIVFANREEARHCFDTTPENAARRIAETGATAAIKLGAEGALIAKGSDVFHIPPHPTSVVDTTAAGDMFAAGFLHGLLQGKDLKTSGKIATILASDVISRVGATVSENALAQVSG